MNPDESNPFAGATNSDGTTDGNNANYGMAGLSGYSDNGATMADSMASAEDNLTAAGLASSVPPHAVGLEQIVETDPNPRLTSSEVDDKPLVPAAPVPGSIGSVTSVPPNPPLAPNLDMPIPPSSSAMPNLAPAPSSTASSSAVNSGAFAAPAASSTSYNYGAPGANNSNAVETGNRMPVMASAAGTGATPSAAPVSTTNTVSTEPKLPGVAPIQADGVASGDSGTSSQRATGGTAGFGGGQTTSQNRDALSTIVSAPTPFSGFGNNPQSKTSDTTNSTHAEISLGTSSKQKFKQIVMILVGVIAVLVVGLIVMIILYIGALNNKETVYVNPTDGDAVEDPIGGTGETGATSQVSNLSCTTEISSDSLSNAWYGALNGTRTIAASFVDGNLAGVSETVKTSYDSNEMAEIAKTEIGIDRAAYLEQSGLAEEPFLRSYEVVNNDLTMTTSTTDTAQITTQNAGTFGLAVENEAVVTAYDPVKAAYEAAGFVCTVE